MDREKVLMTHKTGKLTKVFSPVPFAILWPFNLTLGFGSVYYWDDFVKPFPPELLVGILWSIIHGAFLIYLWKRRRAYILKYLVWTAFPLFCAVYIGLFTYTFRLAYRDGEKTVNYHRLRRW